MPDATELDEAAIRARLEAATPGPWIHLEVQDGDECGPLPELRPTEGWSTPEAAAEDVWFNADTAADAEFIAHARTDVGLLLTALDEARADAAAANGALGAAPEILRLAEMSDQVGAWMARAEAAEGALAAVRALVDTACHHCGSGPDADGDHSCPCRLSNSECLEHTLRPVMPGELRAALATPTTTEGGEGS